MSESTLGSNLDLEAGGVVSQPEAAPRKAGKAAAGEKRVRIILEENDEIPPTGQFFSLNGKAYILRPGEEADVPQGIIDILDNAVGSVPVLDSTTRQVIGYRDKLRFPYRIMTGGRK